jgi:integrase
MSVSDAVPRPILKRERPTVFEDVRAMLRWAVWHGDLDHNPVEAMKKPAAATPRTCVLTPQEIKTLWEGLPTALARSKTCQRIIKLCLVTAQRVGEVAGMAVSELDLEHGIWRLPGPRVKNQHEYIVPLSNLAISIIQEALEDAGKQPKFVFPSGDEPFSPAAGARTIVRASEPTEDRPLGRFNIASWSAHDLRRTALSTIASLGVLPIVIGHIANHRSVTKANVTFLHYVHYSYQREVREGLDLWAGYLEAIINNTPIAELVPLLATAQ